MIYVEHCRRGTRLGIRSRHRFWRQLTGWIAVYAFILQGIFLGLAGPHAQAAAPSAFCHSDPAALATGEVPDPDDADLHCPLCAPTGDDVPPLARVSVPVVLIGERGIVLWAVGDAPVISSFRSSEKRSRAPPVAA